MSHYYTGTEKVNHMWRLLQGLKICGNDANIISHKVRVWCSACISYMLCDFELEIYNECNDIYIDIDPNDDIKNNTFIDKASHRVKTPVIFHKDDNNVCMGEFSLYEGTIILSSYPFKSGHTYKTSVQVIFETN